MAVRTRLKAVGAGLIILGLASIAYADAFVPGSADDPLVTKSYVDEKIQALRAEGYEFVVLP